MYEFELLFTVLVNSKQEFQNLISWDVIFCLLHSNLKESSNVMFSVFDRVQN